MPATTIGEEGDDQFKPTHCPDNRRRGSGDGSRTAGVCQAPQTSAPQGAPAGSKTGYYEKGNVRIRYTEIGTGFPLLATPGGGLNSRIAVWANAVINIPEEFKNDFRVITMDQRNAAGGKSTGCGAGSTDPWGAFADDQLGLMDHLGIRQFFFLSAIASAAQCAMKLMERAPQRVVAALLSQPVGHRPEQPDLHVSTPGRDVWGPRGVPRAPARRRDGKRSRNTCTASTALQPDFVYSVSRDFAKSCRRRCWCCPTT